MKVLSLLPLVDWLALAAFFALWIGYAWFARFWGIRQRSLIATTNRYRGFWMLQATARDPRMLDGVIVQNLSHTPSFFSSTSIIIIGGLFALLGTTDKAAELVREIPFAQPTPILVFEFKILVLVGIFVYPTISRMFVHLRLHTEFSVVDGTNRIDDIVRAAAADGQPALAITDLGNLFGAIKFYKEARGKGVKPLIGAEIVMEGLGKDPGVLSRMILLVQGSQGYLNLSELLARAWTRNVVKAQAVVKLEWLKELSEGLILLSGAQAGPVGQALVQGDAARATDLALQLASIFPHRFYLELQRAGRHDDGVQWPARCNSRLG
jgi:hypothetical protein